jgi:hypothetical protein
MSRDKKIRCESETWTLFRLPCAKGLIKKLPYTGFVKLGACGVVENSDKFNC